MGNANKAIRALITWVAVLVLAILVVLMADGNKLAWGAPPTFEVIMVGCLTILVLPFFIFSLKAGRRVLFFDYLLMIFFVYTSCGSILAISSRQETAIWSYAPHALAIGSYFIGRIVNVKFYALFLSRAVLVLSLWMAVNMFLWRLDLEVKINEKSQNLFHVEFVMVYPAIIFLYYSKTHTLLRRVGMVFLFLGCLITKEITTYLGALLLCFFWPQIMLGKLGSSLLARKHRKTIFVFGILLVMIIFVLGSMLPLTNLGQDFGLEVDKEANVGSRLAAYQISWSRFMDSPWVGGLYSQSRMADLTFDIIPTHNDWLDFLAGGGVVGFLLIAVSWVMIFLKANKYRLNSFQANTHPSFNMVFALWTMFSMSMMFNSPCSTPRIIFFWGISMGLLVNFIQSDTLYQNSLQGNTR